MALRVIQISDTHLLSTGGAVLRNFEIAADYANRLQPDLVVHTGDAVGLCPDWTHDKEFARDAFGSSLNAPVRVLPGNHDTGETGPVVWKDFHATSERVQGHRAAFDGDRFSETYDGWLLVGLNSEMMGSGLPEEEEQWRWLDETVASSRASKFALFQHKPVWRPKGMPQGALLSIPPASQRRLLSRLRGKLQATGTGHLHLARPHRRGDTLVGWGPSTSFITGLPTRMPNKPGIVEWRFSDVDVERIDHNPPGLTALDFEEIPEFIEALAQIDRDYAPAPAGP
jgi:3',5'-cyclic AMP phosphodiesterase CpdA